MPSLGADKASGVRQILFVQGNFRIVLGAFLERMSHFSTLVAAFLATGFGAIVGGMTRLSAFEAGNVAIPLLLEFLVAAIPGNLCVFRLAFFVSHFLLWFATIVASGFSVLGHCEIKQTLGESKGALALCKKIVVCNERMQDASPTHSYSTREVLALLQNLKQWQ